MAAESQGPLGAGTGRGRAPDLQARCPSCLVWLPAPGGHTPLRGALGQRPRLAAACPLGSRPQNLKPASLPATEHTLAGPKAPNTNSTLYTTKLCSYTLHPTPRSPASEAAEDQRL